MTAARKVDTEALRSWATVRQLEYLDAIVQAGSLRGAAKIVGVDHAVLTRSIDALEKKALAGDESAVRDARLGYAEGHWNDGVAPGYRMGKVTVHRKNGVVEQTWERQHPDAARQEQAMRAAIEAMKEEIPRIAALPDATQHTNSNLCNCYVITDYHLSMLSHSEETGADWDLKIAERTLIAWFSQAIAQSPESETAVFCQLSDLLHADGLEPLTPASKHVLDVDTRFYKVVRTVIRLIRQIVDMLLAKHKRLHIIMADANHDPVSQIWLRELFAVFYEDEPRITVDRSPSPYNAFEFGSVALFFHHGHKRKVTNVQEVFAAQFREMFGRTKYAYAHTGHLHSIDVKENNLMVVEQHRTLAAPDAYAARGGWLSGRDAQVITYHREYGEVSRVRINSNMLA